FGVWVSSEPLGECIQKLTAALDRAAPPAGYFLEDLSRQVLLGESAPNLFVFVAPKVLPMLEESSSMPPNSAAHPHLAGDMLTRESSI
ncbi:MAG TPA: hypothetical protein VGF97_06360, partial [Rhizomicrobium sp.]